MATQPPTITLAPARAQVGTAADSSWPSGHPARDELPRRLGFWAATSIVVGSVVGAGIFRVPSAVADGVGSVGGIALVWTLGGIVTTCGALALAELAAALPEAGGVFVYLREAYGSGVAFLYGWALLIIGPTGSAAVAAVFAEYLGVFVPLSLVGRHLVASAVIAATATAGIRSVRGAGAIQTATAGAKVGALAGIIVAAFVLGDPANGSLGRGSPVGSMRFDGVGLGLVAALWAYNGFQEMASVAGEVRDPARTLPRALIVGMAVVVLVYLAANAAFLYILPFSTLRASPLVASDTMIHVLGAAGAGAVAAAIMLSTFGSVNGAVLARPRVFYAMAADGLLFRPLARVHPRYSSPHVAVATYAAVAIAFVWFRSFEQLTEAFVVGIWPFLAAAAAGVLVLRRTRPDLARPYRTPGYPIVPLVFVAGTLCVVISALVAHPATTFAGMGMTLLGVPVYLLRRGTRRRDVR